MSSLAILATPPVAASAQPVLRNVNVSRGDMAFSGDVVPLRAVAPERSTYGVEPRGRLVPGLAALAVVGGLFLALVSAGVIGGKQERATVTAVRLSQELPPPPPPEAARPENANRPASPLVAPPPPVTLPALGPVEIAQPVPANLPVAAAPTQPVAVPAPPAPPAPVAAAPASTMSTGRDLTANLIAAEPPRYPLDSRRNREQGTVVLLVTVGLDGKVAALSLSRSSGFDRLDRAALGAVKHWRWSPTREAGVAMMVQGLVQIPFVLQG